MSITSLPKSSGKKQLRTRLPRAYRGVAKKSQARVARAFPRGCDVTKTLKVSPRDAVVTNTPLPCLRLFLPKNLCNNYFELHSKTKYL